MARCAASSVLGSHSSHNSRRKARFRGFYQVLLVFFPLPSLCSHNKACGGTSVSGAGFNVHSVLLVAGTNYADD